MVNTALPAADPDEPEVRQGIQSIEVGGRLLQALASRPRAMMLRDLAAAADMPPAKAHRYLVSLIRMGLVEQDSESGRYDLGPFALTLGLAALNRLDPLQLARPVLQELCEVIDQTVSIAVWGNRGPTVVQWLESSHPVTVNLRAGAVMPLLNSSTGRCFAAFLPAAITQDLIAAELAAAKRSDVAALPHSRPEFEAILREARDRGVARVIGDLIPGVHSLSAPVYGADGQMVLALTALGHAGLFDSAWEGTIATVLRDRAGRLSGRLGSQLGSH